MEDRRCTLWTVLITGASIALALLYSLVIFGATHRGGGWLTPSDGHMINQAGASLLHGHLSQVYSKDSGLYALPLAFPIGGVDSFIINALHLPSSPHEMWVLVEVPLFLVAGAPVLQGARRLAWELGLRSRLWVIQVLTAFFVFVPLVRWGHVEDSLALTFVLYALRKLIRGEAIHACFYLSLSISSKQWAIMLLPLFALAVPQVQRRAAILAALAIPVLLAGTFLVVDFQPALRAFSEPATQVFGYPGHPWFAENWLGAHTAAANRYGATLLACGVAWYRKDRLVHPIDVVATAGLILMIRPLSESINYSYYWSPGLLLLTLIAIADSERLALADWGWPVLALSWTLPVSNDLTALDWWAGELVLLAVIGYRVTGVVSARKPAWSGKFHSPGRRQTAEAAG